MAKGKGVLSNPFVRFLIGAGVGAIGGYIANKAYESSTADEKRQWKKNRLMHHGALGCFAATAGAAASNPFLAGTGVGLALTDLKDADEWFSGKTRKRDA